MWTQNLRLKLYTRSSQPQILVMSGERVVFVNLILNKNIFKVDKTREVICEFMSSELKIIVSDFNRILVINNQMNCDHAKHCVV